MKGGTVIIRISNNIAADMPMIDDGSYFAEFWWSFFNFRKSWKKPRFGHAKDSGATRMP